MSFSEPLLIVIGLKSKVAKRQETLLLALYRRWFIHRTGPWQAALNRKSSFQEKKAKTSFEVDREREMIFVASAEKANKKLLGLDPVRAAAVTSSPDQRTEASFRQLLSL